MNMKQEKDKMVGKITETIGKHTNDEEMELKGKLKSMKVDLGERVEDIKEDALEKTNDFIDKMNQKKHKR